MEPSQPNQRKESSMTPAEMLKRALAGTQGRTPQPITDEFAKAIARRLESRGIVKVPAWKMNPSPSPTESEPHWTAMRRQCGRSRPNAKPGVRREGCNNRSRSRVSTTLED
jgi:hypothetical protein